MSTGTLQSQTFTTPGSFTFNVPAGVSRVWVTATAAGAGGQYAGASISGTGGGASGEQCVQFPLGVTPGGTVTGTIGAKGSAGTSAGSVVATAGGNTTIDNGLGDVITLQGGGAPNPSIPTGSGGNGGGRLGQPTSTAPPFPSAYEAPWCVGGAWGGVGAGTSGSNVPVAGGAGPGWAGGLAGGVFSGSAGGGGGSTIFGQGGAGAPTGQATATAVASNAYGCGGGAASAGAGTRTGADGVCGAVCFFYVGA